jgi:hypothetical protein
MRRTLSGAKPAGRAFPKRRIEAVRSRKESPTARLRVNDQRLSQRANGLRKVVSRSALTAKYRPQSAQPQVARSTCRSRSSSWSCITSPASAAGIGRWLSPPKRRSAVMEAAEHESRDAPCSSIYKASSERRKITWVCAGSLRVIASPHPGYALLVRKGGDSSQEKSKQFYDPITAYSHLRCENGRQQVGMAECLETGLGKTRWDFQERKPLGASGRGESGDIFTSDRTYRHLPSQCQLLQTHGANQGRTFSHAIRYRGP